MIKLIDLLKEIRINNPNITIEKVRELLNSFYGNKKINPIIIKYGWDKFNSSSEWLESLSNLNLETMYSELKNIK